MISRHSMSFLQWLTLVLSTASSLTSAESPIFSVQFGYGEVAFAGRVDSGETGKSFVEVVKSARPDLRIVTDGLVVDPSTVLPNTADIRSLLGELGLSTHEGRFEIWPDRVLIGGLTDSLVTLTALKIRLEPILKGRRLISHICIVGTEDLPKIAVSLSGGEPAAGNPGIIARPREEKPFEVPGLLLEKLYPTLVMLSDFDRLEGKTSAPSMPLRAMPVEMTGAGAGGPVPPSPSLPPLVIAATPVPQFETLPSVRFSRNSFLLQANQAPVFDELAKYLLAPDRRGRLVVLESVKPSGGSSAFNDYLCERRGDEVKRFLAERGVDAGTLSARVIESSSPIDDGEVRLRMEIPLPPPDPAVDSPARVPSGGTENPANGGGPPGGLKPFKATTDAE